MDKDGDKKEPMKKAVADKKKNPFAKKTNEALKGGQKKLDVDGDGDIESDDLADLRAKKEKKVDESTAWKSKAQAMKESLESMLPTIQESEMDPEILKIVQAAQQKDPEGFKDAAGKGPEALAAYLNNFTPDQLANVSQPDTSTQDASATSPDEESDMAYNTESLAESTDFDRMKQFLTRLNG